MNELYVKALVYFNTNANSHDKAVDELFAELEGTGVEIEFLESRLRDSDGNEIEE